MQTASSLHIAQHNSHIPLASFQFLIIVPLSLIATLGKLPFSRANGSDFLVQKKKKLTHTHTHPRLSFSFASL